MKKLFLYVIPLAILLIFSVQPTNATPSLDMGWEYDEVQYAYTDSDYSPYVYALSDEAMFSITDAYITGDIWYVYDYGSLILTTDFIAFPDYWGDTYPDQCWESADYSSGQVLLTVGSHELTIQGDGGGGLPAGVWARIDSVPEPATMLLLGSGLLGLGFIGRKRRFFKKS